MVLLRTIKKDIVAEDKTITSLINEIVQDGRGRFV